MSLDLVITLLTNAFYTVLIILLPVLGAGLIIGILISIFQAATSIQEMTLTFVPKIIVTAVVIIILLPFMANKMISFTKEVFNIMLTAIK
jgi:flagellar biosynthetic protein FliQ